MNREKIGKQLVCFALALSLGTVLQAANAADETIDSDPVAGSAAELPVDPDTGYRDVPADQYYYEPVKWAVSEGLIGGDDAEFLPYTPVTREQVMTLLWRMEGSPEPDAAADPFSDVPPEDDAFAPVLWAYQSKIASGVSKSEFAPDRLCTRGEFITFLWRAEGRWPMTVDGLPFNDVTWRDYYCSAVAWSTDYGVTNGSGGDSFLPNELCTRADAVTFLYRSAHRRADPDFLVRDERGWRCPLDEGFAAGNWLIRDGRYYHFDTDGYLDKVSLVPFSLVRIPGYYIHPMKATVYSTREERIEAMISTAYEYLNDPFVVYHSTAPHTDGVDCSGLVMQCLYAAGFDPYPATPEHHSYTEYDSRTLWHEVDMPHIDPSEMQRGDLVFYKKTKDATLINHIAIYLGNGYVIEAWPDKVTDKYPVDGGPHKIIYGVARPIT